MPTCERCRQLVEDVITVVVEAGDDGSWSSPPYPPTFEEWCPACEDTHKHLGRADDEDEEA